MNLRFKKILSHENLLVGIFQKTLLNESTYYTHTQTLGQKSTKYFQRTIYSILRTKLATQSKLL